MAWNESQKPLDSIDVKILRTLQNDGRASWASIAGIVGLSAPSVTERVRRLEESGYISGFSAEIAPAAIGLGLLGFVAVSIRDIAEHEALLDHIRNMPEIQECHVVGGDYDYLLKVRASSPEALAELLRDRVRCFPGVSRTKTVLVLETVKETRALPVPDPSE